MNNLKDNSPQRTMRIWIAITILAIFGIFLPFIAGMDGFGGGFAIATLCFFLAITGIVVIIIYAGRASLVSKILRGENLLVHWTYNPEEWQCYTEHEYKTEKQGKKILFYIVAGCAVFFGIVFFVMDPEGGAWVLISMVALIALIAFVAWFSAWYNHRQNKQNLGETFITPKAAYINRQLHTWNSLGASLKSVELNIKPEQSLLTITYTAPTRTGVQEYDARIPVPKGKEAEAEKILQKFKEDNTL